MRHLTVQSLGIGTVLNTPHVLPIGGRCAWLHNNTRCKQYTIQSQSLSLLTDSGSCRGKRHKSKATQTHGEKGWSGLAGGQEVCGLIMGDKAGNVSWDQTSSIQPPAAFIFFQGQRRDVHRSGATQLSSYPTSNLERSS